MGRRPGQTGRHERRTPSSHDGHAAGATRPVPRESCLLPSRPGFVSCRPSLSVLRGIDVHGHPGGRWHRDQIEAPEQLGHRAVGGVAQCLRGLLKRRGPIQPEQPLQPTVGVSEAPPVSRPLATPTRYAVPGRTACLVSFGPCGRLKQQLHTGSCPRQVAGQHEDQWGSRIIRGGGRHTEGSQTGDQRSRGPSEGGLFTRQKHPIGHRPVADHDRPLGTPSRFEHALQQRSATHRQGALVDASQPGPATTSEDDRVEPARLGD